MKDQWWDIFEFNKYDLHLFEKAYSQEIQKWITWSTPTAEKEYVSLYFRADQMQNNYFYAEYHLLTMLGDLGGLYGIVMGLGWFIAAPLVSRLSKAAMVHSNYRLQSYDFDDS